MTTGRSRTTRLSRSWSRGPVDGCAGLRIAPTTSTRCSSVCASSVEFRPDCWTLWSAFTSPRLWNAGPGDMRDCEPHLPGEAVDGLTEAALHAGYLLGRLMVGTADHQQDWSDDPDREELLDWLDRAVATHQTTSTATRTPSPPGLTMLRASAPSRSPLTRTGREQAPPPVDTPVGPGRRQRPSTTTTSVAPAATATGQQSSEPQRRPRPAAFFRSPEAVAAQAGSPARRMAVPSGSMTAAG
jgi:hypothetical protein